MRGIIPPRISSRTYGLMWVMIGMSVFSAVTAVNIWWHAAGVTPDVARFFLLALICAFPSGLVFAWLRRREAAIAQYFHPGRELTWRNLLLGVAFWSVLSVIAFKWP